MNQIKPFKFIKNKMNQHSDQALYEKLQPILQKRIELFRPEYNLPSWEALYQRLSEELQDYEGISTNLKNFLTEITLFKGALNENITNLQKQIIKKYSPHALIFFDNFCNGQYENNDDLLASLLELKARMMRPTNDHKLLGKIVKRFQRDGYYYQNKIIGAYNELLADTNFFSSKIQTLISSSHLNCAGEKDNLQEIRIPCSKLNLDNTQDIHSYMDLISKLKNKEVTFKIQEASEKSLALLKSLGETEGNNIDLRIGQTLNLKKMYPDNKKCGAQTDSEFRNFIISQDKYSELFKTARQKIEHFNLISSALVHFKSLKIININLIWSRFAVDDKTLSDFALCIKALPPQLEIVHLNFSEGNHCVSDTSVQKIVAALQKQTLLKVIGFLFRGGKNHVTNNGLKYISTLFKNICELQSFTLNLSYGNNSVKDEGFMALMKEIKNCAQLQKLIFNFIGKDNNISTQGLQCYAKSIVELKKLQTVYLFLGKKHALNAKVMKELNTSIAKLENIQMIALYLHDGKEQFSDNDIQNLATSLEKKTIKYFSLEVGGGNNQVTDTGLAKIISNFNKQGELYHFTIGTSNGLHKLTDTSIIGISKMIKHNPKLMNLSLFFSSSLHEFTAKSIIKLGNNLKYLLDLRVLQLCFTESKIAFNDDCIQSVAKGISNHKMLSTFFIEFSSVTAWPITDCSIDSLSSAFKTCPSLTAIDISIDSQYNNHTEKITDKSLIKLWESIKSLAKLKKIRISLASNTIATDESVIALSNNIFANSRPLEIYINFSGATITDNGIIAISNEFKKYTQLLKLELRFDSGKNHITNDGAKYLIQSIKKNEYLNNLTLSARNGMNNVNEESKKFVSQIESEIQGLKCHITY